MPKMLCEIAGSRWLYNAYPKRVVKKDKKGILVQH